jgi:hypothetical protein
VATVALYRFDELADNVFPVDAQGNMVDLGDDSGSAPPLALPIVVTALTGRGRQFGTDIGLQALESVADSTRLLRDVTVRAFLTYEIGNAGNGDVGTIVVRGKTGSAAERVLFGLEIERLSATVAQLRARWQEASGTDAIVSGFPFKPPPSGKFFHVAMSRQWLTTTSCTVTYLVNDTILGTETVTQGNIGNGSGGALVVGAAGDGAGNYERFLPDDSIIDSLTIEDDAMADEELRQEFRRIAVHQPNGYRVLRAYQPPGGAWTREPGSIVQRLFGAEGDGLGFTIAQMEKLRDDYLPDRAYDETLQFWERITLLAPRPSDTIAQRRLRVLGFLQRILGYSVPDVKSSLEPLFGLTASQIDVVEYDGLRTDTFDDDDITAPPSKTWVTYPRAGTVSIAAGICTITAPNTSNADWPTAGGSPPWREASLSALVGEDTDGATLVTKIDDSTGGTNSVTNVVLGHIWRTSNLQDGIAIGRREFGAFDALSYSIVTGGVQGAMTNLVTTLSLARPYWLLTRYKGGGDFEVAVSTTGPLTGYGTYYQITGGPTGIKWCGFGLVAKRTGTLGTNMTLEFDDAYIYEPSGIRGYAWQAFRDPGLGGSYDLATAQLQLEKQGPAHAHGCAVDVLEGFTFSPTGTGRLGCDALFPSTQIIT